LILAQVKRTNSQSIPHGCSNALKNAANPKNKISTQMYLEDQ
jgi:hypothetical protein